MIRLFNEHKIRTTISLDGAWEFFFPVNGTTIDPTEWKTGKKEIMSVPGCWENIDAYKTYRGQAVAHKIIKLDTETDVRLVFKGISHTARIFVDGTEIGGHHNAYTPFTLDAGRLSAGEHELLVHISNEHGEISALHVPNDYYNYGGISRPVEMHLIHNALLIRHVHAVTTPDGDDWKVECSAEVINLSESPIELTLNATVADNSSATKLTATPGTTEVQWEMSCSNVDTWSPENPALYMLETQLESNGVVVDDLIERIGFRTVAINGQDIMLNDKKFFPMGFNRHEDHPTFGCAIPVEVMRQDLEQMKAMNANSVRTSHYPNDERFLDICDEQGILVWEENHARGLGIKKMHHPRFREQCAACNEEMVREHFNHPSIYVWGILNECESGMEEGAAMYQEQFDQLRSLDSSRPLTFASCRFEKDLCQKMVDISGWNIYPRWYNNDDTTEFVNEMIDLRSKEGMGDNPLIFSEFGAGALFGFRDPVRRSKWSEERQCDILEELLSVILNHQRVGGAYIWQFCDVRVSEAWQLQRPRGYNNKGAVDEHRRHKLAFETIKRLFAKKSTNTKNIQLSVENG